jgi:hypothetical protein
LNISEKQKSDKITGDRLLSLLLLLTFYFVS